MDLVRVPRRARGRGHAGRAPGHARAGRPSRRRFEAGGREQRHGGHAGGGSARHQHAQGDGDRRRQPHVHGQRARRLGAGRHGGHGLADPLRVLSQGSEVGHGGHGDVREPVPRLRRQDAHGVDADRRGREVVQEELAPRQGHGRRHDPDHRQEDRGRALFLDRRRAGTRSGRLRARSRNGDAARALVQDPAGLPGRARRLPRVGAELRLGGVERGAGTMTRRARVSQKSLRFTESVIREMTRLAHAHGAVNLSQGFPDFAAPEAIKEAAARAVAADVHQYAITWGAKSLRDALVTKQQRFTGLTFDPEREITVCCGSTECMASVMLALVDPGDEVIVFEPYYENYGPDAILSGAVPRFVRLREPDWSFDPAELAAAFNAHTRAIVVNTPNNPTGKVFARAEMEQIAALCRKWDVIAVTDEIYEHILYDGAEHVSMAALDGMRERTVTISGLSKTWSVTGWRIGWCLAPSDLTNAIR